MELHQFRHSAFCEKVRLILAYKGLQATLLEVTPGLGQLGIFRLSGQRQVPVLVDGQEVIPDSTAIALHLEERHPLPALVPAEPDERARCLLMEDWADTALATGARLALLQAAAADPVIRSSLLPEATPAPIRTLFGSLPGDVMAPVTETLRDVLTPCQARQMRRSLESLTCLITRSPYLVGNGLSLADLAVAAQLSLLKFPASAGAPLAGRGVEGLADHPDFEPLFSWRDRVLGEAHHR